MNPRFLSTLLVLLFASCVGSPAFALDPECVGATGAAPVYSGCELKLSGVTADLRFCSPQADADGDLIPDGTVTSCTVSLDGTAVSTVPITTSGELFSVSVTGKNLGHQIGAFCTNAEGITGEVWVSDLCFPSGAPGQPHHLP